MFDKADSININNCKEINSIFYWFLTNQPQNLIFPLGKYHNKVLKYTNVKNCYYTDWEEKYCKGVKFSYGLKSPAK